jgi:hypothetical protein
MAARGRFDLFAMPLGNDRYLRTPDGPASGEALGARDIL